MKTNKNVIYKDCRVNGDLRVILNQYYKHTGNNPPTLVTFLDFLNNKRLLSRKDCELFIKYYGNK